LFTSFLKLSNGEAVAVMDMMGRDLMDLMVLSGVTLVVVVVVVVALLT
jgi:hypothetical protein